MSMLKSTHIFLKKELLKKFLNENLENGIYLSEIPQVIDFYTLELLKDYNGGDDNPSVFLNSGYTCDGACHSISFSKTDFKLG